MMDLTKLKTYDLMTDEEKEELLGYTTVKARNIPLRNIPMFVRLANVLRQGHLTTLGDVAMMTKKQFMKFKNCGKQTAAEMESILQCFGLKFDDRSYCFNCGQELRKRKSLD
jgi:DNA-directed RNA polymerase alpha subunit